MKLMFQKVEELLVVVDESDVDTMDEQYCNTRRLMVHKESLNVFLSLL